MLVFFIGFMGAGKTTLGSAVAAQLGYHFVDLDKEIEQYSGKTIPELFKHHGESEFRKIEQQVLHQSVKKFQDPPFKTTSCLIACGGGTPCYQENLAFMKKNGFVVYLEASPEILCERLLRPSNTPRPLLPYQEPAPLLQHIRTLLNQRRPIYEAAHWRC